MKGLSFKHPLSSKFPPPIKEDRAKEILEDVKANKTAAKHELILGHMRYACDLVSCYLYSLGSTALSEELTEAAFYGLVDGVNNISKGLPKHNDITPYLAVRIHGEIKNALKKRHVISTPRGESEIKTQNLIDVETKSDFSIEFEDELNKVVEDETDEALIELLRLGYNPKQAADKLGLHRGTAYRRLKRIRRQLTDE